MFGCNQLFFMEENDPPPPPTLKVLKVLKLGSHTSVVSFVYFFGNLYCEQCFSFAVKSVRKREAKRVQNISREAAICARPLAFTFIPANLRSKGGESTCNLFAQRRSLPWLLVSKQLLEHFNQSLIFL